MPKPVFDSPEALLATLPAPLSPGAMRHLYDPAPTLDDVTHRQSLLLQRRDQVAAAIDQLDLAIQQNHADFLAHRASWTYDQRIAVDARVRILRRQRQTLQELYGQNNRVLRTLQRAQMETPPPSVSVVDVSFERQFVEVARRLLHPDTYQLLADQAREVTA